MKSVTLIIDSEQAETDKCIYREYLEGYSIDKIAARLMADGILTGAGKEKWWTSTIHKILRNEKYIGDALLQKIYTTDFLSKTRIKNNGTVPQYYVEGNHPESYQRDNYDSIAEEIFQLRELKAKSETDSVIRDERLARITVLEDRFRVEFKSRDKR